MITQAGENGKYYGILDVEFPRDRNDFMPAREGAYVHNVRYITKPDVQDVRTFL